MNGGFRPWLIQIIITRLVRNSRSILLLRAGKRPGKHGEMEISYCVVRRGGQMVLYTKREDALPITSLASPGKGRRLAAHPLLAPVTGRVWQP